MNDRDVLIETMQDAFAKSTLEKFSGSYIDSCIRGCHSEKVSMSIIER